MNTFIYALCDPDTKTVRYVGKSDNPQGRYYNHIKDKHRTHKVAWINKLKSQGKKPILTILEEIGHEYWEECEKKWISFYKSDPNIDLTNYAEGKISYEDFLKGYTQVREEKTVLSPLTPSDLADLFASIEIKDLRVDSILMNANTYSTLRKWGRDVLDIECEKENFEKGLMARIWGAYILITRNIPDGIVIATSTKEYGVCATLVVGQEKFYNLKGI